MLYKSVPGVLAKSPMVVADPDAEGGEFSAIVSVFNNIDSDGDAVIKGAFADSIAAWKDSGNTLPVLWSHRIDDPAYNIGGVVDIAEVGAGDERIPKSAHPFVHANGGLWVRGLIDSGEDASPVAKSARRLMRERRVTQFSFAYDIQDAEKADGGRYQRLKRLWLHEVSPTQIGSNQLTDLGSAKHESTLDTKAARVESPRDVRSRIQIAAFTTLFG